MTTLAMVFKLLKPAQKNWNRLKGFELLTLVVNNLPFKNSKQVEEEASDRNVA
ncbi:putative transposase domain protein [Candidatus Erwinia dacicola]|uniref:Transposase domain protein n=2 Tax=Candidatus Erwinia dacicola TaxID=252393 RepID=A0A328TP60_9GAMM|nr:putative transposase domain protein [Candidatus Erwinia dacicola]